MQSADLFEVLKSFTLNFPIIREVGIYVQECITLVFKSYAEGSRFIGQLSKYPLIISEADGIPAMKKKLQQPIYQGVFLRMSGVVSTDKQRAKLELLRSIAAGEMEENKRICCPAFVVYTGVLPDELRDNTLVIQVPTEEIMELDDTGDFYRLVPRPEQLGQIRQKIIDLGEIPPKEVALTFAACFLYPKLHERGGDGRYEAILSLARAVCRGEFETPRTEDVISLVADRILDVLKNSAEDRICRLPNLESSMVAKKELNFFYDENYLYLSDALFGDICAPLACVDSIRGIKFALKEAGILSGSAGRYVCKMYYYSSYGIMENMTMLKLNMERLKIGDESFKDYLL